MRFTFFLLLFFAVQVASCKARRSNASGLEGNDKAAAANGSLAIPNPGTFNNPLNVSAIVGYIQEQRKQNSEVEKRLKLCLEELEKSKSPYTIVARHFYCSHPQYSVARPNYIACWNHSGRISNGRPLYAPERYDYCAYQEPPKDNSRLENFPKYDQTEIDKNKAAGKVVGEFAEMTPHQRAVFKYVMLTADKLTFALVDVQRFLDQVYQVYVEPGVVVDPKRMGQEWREDEIAFFGDWLANPLNQNK